MAITFVSPKQRQRIFFGIIAISLILIFGGISLAVFLPSLLHKGSALLNEFSSVNKNSIDVSINFKLLDSPQVKNLQPFQEIQTQFAYTVEDKDGVQTSGTIGALNQDDAKKQLEVSGFKVITIQPANAGRTDPFISY